MKSKLASFHQTKIAIAIAAILITAPAYSGTFYPVVESGCTNPPINAGKQYRDPYYSGVAQDRWSVLYRWQGRLDPPPQYVDWAYNAFTPVSWDIGRYTGLSVPPNNWWQITQMGRVEQQHPGADPADNAMPGVQANCGEVGMLMNTWWTPHIPVTGGTPNDMYGYAWSPANQPKAFPKQPKVFPADPDVYAELVLQANIAMTGWQPTPGNQLDAGAYIAFFVYLRDTKNNLPSFGVLATTHGTGNQASYMANGLGPGVDYCNSITSTPIDCGGWFVSAPISPGGGESPPSNPANKKWITVRYSTPTQVYASPFFSSSTASNFFRAHITATNLKNMVNQFNDTEILCGGLVCPRGYSLEPADYVVEYAGIIFELLPGSNWTNDNTYLYPYQYGGQWVEADASKVQIAVAARMSGLAVYQYVP